jgi:hypothetical protein
MPINLSCVCGRKLVIRAAVSAVGTAAIGLVCAVAIFLAIRAY